MTLKTYHVEGMDCANCARELEEGISKLVEVQSVRVDFATAKMRVEGAASFEVLSQRAAALGKTLHDDESIRTRHASSLQNPQTNFFTYLLSRAETRLALLGGVIIIIGVVVSGLGGTVSLAETLYILATAIAALPIARSGIRTLLINRTFNINLLMTIAAIGAILIGETLEAATVVFLFAIGEALEGFTADRARQSLRRLMELTPSVAIRIRRAVSDGHDGVVSLLINSPPLQRIGEETGGEVVLVTDLLPNDLILVKPGERIPMDGIVTSGDSGVNQAPITGESMPVHKSPGAEVFAGAINGDGALEIRVTHRAEDNTLSRIIQLVEEAQSVRAPSQRLIDQFARWYTPGVVVLAALVALVPPLLFNAPFYGAQGWLYRALELLVIACPCSLVISTPVTVISAITAAARRGVLIKGGAFLESLGGIKVVAFDKTGTLTRGQPTVTLSRAIDCGTTSSQPLSASREGLKHNGGTPSPHWSERGPGGTVSDCIQCDDVLALASAVEYGSTHPLAKAVVDAAQARGLSGVYAPAESVVALNGRGIQGRINGKTVTIGNHALFEAEHPHSRELCQWVDSAEADGNTTMLLSDGDRVRGFIAVADEARPESHEVLHQLQAQGIQTVMLTGDNVSVAKAIGKSVGVDDVQAGLLPADKVTAVQALMSQHGSVAMVGDGVNDTPALAASTVGIAMGAAGSAQALETADVALMADDLRQLPYAVKLSRFAHHLIRQNIVLSIGLKLAIMLIALAGFGTLWLAILADVGMSLLVTLNGMRPLRS